MNASLAVRALLRIGFRVAVAGLAGIGVGTILLAWVGVPDEMGGEVTREGLRHLAWLCAQLGILTWMFGAAWAGSRTLAVAVAAGVTAMVAALVLQIVSFVLVPVPASGVAFYALLAAIGGVVGFRPLLDRLQRFEGGR